MAGLGLEELKLVANVVASKDISEGQKARTAAGIINAAQRSRAKAAEAKTKADAKLEAANEKARVRTLERVEDKEFKQELADESAELRKELKVISSKTPEEIKKLNAQIQDIENRQEKRDEDIRIKNLAQEKGIQKTIADFEFQMEGDYEDPENAGRVDFINTFSNKPEYIHTYTKTFPRGKFKRQFNIDAKVKTVTEKIPLPKHPSGAQLTSRSLSESAIAAGMSEEDFLKAIGVLDANGNPVVVLNKENKKQNLDERFKNFNPDTDTFPGTFEEFKKWKKQSL